MYMLGLPLLIGLYIQGLVDLWVMGIYEDLISLY